MSLNKKRWVVLIACCVANLCLGSIYAWSVFSSSMAPYLSAISGREITSADMAIVYTIANSVGPITMITGGWINDKFGPKKVILAGGLMFGGGMVLSGFATSVSFLIVSYGLVTGLGLGMAYGCTISTAVKYFPDKRGLVGGIATAVYGLSSVVISPLISVLVNRADAPFAFKSIGFVFMVVIILCSLVIERCPEGFVPEGFVPPQDQTRAKGSVDKNWKQMLKTPVFYIMIILLTCGAFSGMMVISQASGIAQEMVGMTALAASTAVSMLALFNASGRIIAGYVSDKIGRINTLMAACLLSVGGLVLLFTTSTGQIASFYIGVSIVGVSFGAFMGVFPGFTVDQFGARYNSVNYGIMFIGFALAGYFGPSVMRMIFQWDGAYQKAFLIAAGFSVVGIVLGVIYRQTKKIK